MRNRHRILFGLVLIAMAAIPLRAYQLALRDGKTVQFEKYHATETVVFYTGADGEEVSIPLTDVDLDRTQQLNSQEPVPLDLPGLSVMTKASPSLAEVARQQKKSTDGLVAKRVFTDDDVLHGSPAVETVQTTPAPSVSVAAQAPTEPMQKIVDRFLNKSQTQLANEVVGDVQFPGRDVWEQKLYGEGQRVLRFAQLYLDRNKKLETMIDPAERSTTLAAAKNFEWQANDEVAVYAQICTEGTQKAKESGKQPN